MNKHGLVTNYRPLAPGPWFKTAGDEEFRELYQRQLAALVESPGGISPPGAPRTVHDPLESHGSRCSAVAMA